MCVCEGREQFVSVHLHFQILDISNEITFTYKTGRGSFLTPIGPDAFDCIASLKYRFTLFVFPLFHSAWVCVCVCVCGNIPQDFERSFIRHLLWMSNSFGKCRPLSGRWISTSRFSLLRLFVRSNTFVFLVVGLRHGRRPMEFPGRSRDSVCVFSCLL